MKKLLRDHGWWIVPTIEALVFVFTTQHALALAIGTIVLTVLEAFFAFFATSHIRGRDRRMLVVPLSGMIVLTAGVLLFLERMMFKIPLIALSVGLLIFTHYAIRHSNQHPELPLYPFVADGYRLIAYALIFYSSIIFFAEIFYFGITTALIAAPLLLIPCAVLFLRTWLDELPYRESLLHACTGEMIYIESAAALLFLPLSYGGAALICLLIMFLYSEYALTKQSGENAHKNDQFISFLIVGIVVLLLIAIAKVR